MRFTESHEWIAVQGKQGTVGITNHAQGELREIVYVALPKIGQKVKSGEEVCVLESTKAAADVYSPVSGTVTAVNEKLRQNPSLLNSNAEQEGWLFQIELTNLRELDGLMDHSGYETLIN